MTEEGQRLAEEDEEGPKAASPGEVGCVDAGVPHRATSESNCRGQSPRKTGPLKPPAQFSPQLSPALKLAGRGVTPPGSSSKPTW